MSHLNYSCAIFLVIFSVIVYSSQQYVGEVCTLQSTGSQAVCKLLIDCPSAREELKKNRRFPQSCGFQGTQPIVCCPVQKETRTAGEISIQSPVSSRIPGQISIQKCRIHSKLVIEKKPLVTLQLDDEEPEETEKNECGHKAVKLIVGGEPAGRKEFPHMAAVGYQKEPDVETRWLCGGTIISESFVLTAAHCLSSMEYGTPKYVRIGITDLNDNSVHNQVIRVAQRIAHPEYRSNSHYHDIALLKLATKATLNSYTVPACLYAKPEVTADMAIVTGWGYTSYAGVTSDELLKVTLDLFDHQTCNNSYKQIGRKLIRGIVNDIQVCAGSKNDSTIDTCQGDSGGPLQIYHINDDIKCMYDIIGVTSFGIKACTGSPGVYTRVSHYIKWIEDEVWP